MDGASSFLTGLDSQNVGPVMKVHGWTNIYAPDVIALDTAGLDFAMKIGTLDNDSICFIPKRRRDHRLNYQITGAPEMGMSLNS